MTDLVATCIPEPGKMCRGPARWLVWFERCGNAYTYMCDEHATQAMKNGVHGYAVVCVRAMSEMVTKAILAPWRDGP